MMPRPLLFLLLAAPAAVRAAGPVAEVTPLVPEAGPAAPAEVLLQLDAARSALALGLSTVAAQLLEQLLAAPETPGADRNTLVLELVSARLDEGDSTAAAKALAGYLGLPTAAYQLRAGLIAIQARRTPDARAVAKDVRPEELAAADRGWYFFLQGALADAAGDFPAAGAAFQQAADAAVSDLQRAQFTQARTRAGLFVGGMTDAQADALKENADRYPGGRLGYGWARQYAVAEATLGHTDVAVAYLQKQLQGLPVAERATNDSFRLLLGLIEGAAPGGAGRNALEGLLTDGADRDLQRVALQLLARDSTAAAAREAFRAKLTELIRQQPPHPILEDLLLFRAQLSLADHHYTGDPDKDPGAEEDAKRVVEQFPGSQLKPEALGVLTGSAWEQARYRTAAEEAAQTRAALPPGDPRAAPLAVLVAEAYFRAGDFQSAADAYAAALAGPPPGVASGRLIFQQVVAEIKADRADEAGRLLDRYAAEPRLDQVNRWQAEWNLARKLQTMTGGTAAAKARVDRLLGAAESAGPAATLPADLRVRMNWLQARLALDAGAEVTADPARAKPFLEEALTRAQALLGSLTDTADLAEDFRQDVTSNTLLLRAQAEFKLAREEDALATLKQLRADYPTSDAAAHSYLDEADHLEEKNDFVGAENVLNQLVGEFKNQPAAPGPSGAKRAEQENTYAPYALFRAALNEERRGEDFYKPAYRILDDLVNGYKQSDLVFYALLKQGDLLRRLNQFGAAQQIYEHLVHNFATHADVLTAELALAACHRAQAATDVSHAESAIAIFDRLRDLPNAPAEVRAEAGFQYGDLLAQGGHPDQAEDAWWSLVRALLPDNAPAGQLGAGGPAWLARALLHLGDLLALEKKLDQARVAYQQVIQKGLPYQATAHDRLQRLGGAPAK
jgi:TolA-binding protein